MGEIFSNALIYMINVFVIKHKGNISTQVMTGHHVFLKYPQW